MTRLQRVFAIVLGVAALALLVIGPARAIIQTQRAQLGIAVVIDVTPSPLAYAPRTIAAQSPSQIAVRFAMHAKGSQDGVDATPIDDISNLVAQSSAQSSLKVQATVTPNPTGTLLVSNVPSTSIACTAGTTCHQSCVYLISVNTAITSWTLREGVSQNFATGFPGTDLKNDSYLQTGTPAPAPTPFVVYPTAWSILASSGNTKTYCVDLWVVVPGTVTGGAYSTQAIYTLFY